MAFTITWNVDADGDWGTASNWSGDRLPTSSDDVGIDTTDFHTVTFSSGTVTVDSLTVGNDAFLMLGGSLTLSAASSFANTLDVSGATLSLGGATTVSGLFTEDTGTVSGTGTLTLAGGASFGDGGAEELMTGAATTVFQGTTTLHEDSLYADGGRVLENEGSFTINAGGSVQLGQNPFGAALGGGTLQNDAGATLTLNSNTAFGVTVAGQMGTTSFINDGMLDTTGEAVSEVQGSFVNTGSVLVQAGAFEVVGAMTGSGTVAVDSGAIFLLDASSTSTANIAHVTKGAAELTGGSGSDRFSFDANFSSQDSVNGGGGTDQVVLNGDYAGLSITGAMMTNVEVLVLGGGHDYNLTTADAVVGAGQSLDVTAAALDSAHTLTFNGGAETDGRFTITGGAGDDVLTGGNGNDTFNLTHGGNDTASGGGGDDLFSMGAAMTAADSIDGGAGTNTLALDGDYSAGLTFAAATLVNVETISLGTGFNYRLVTNDANVAAGQILTVDGSALAAGDTLFFNGIAETDGKFAITGGAGNDVLTGGARADMFDLSAGGNDIARGEGGTDVFSLGAAFTAADKIDGGSGQDRVVLDGDYSAGVVFSATTMVNVETLTLSAGHSYRLTTNDATVASGQTLSVNASGLGAGDTLTFYGSAETNGSFSITGGAGNNVLTGGAGNDSFLMALGGTDTLHGGGGNDVFSMGAFLTTADKIDGGTGHDNVVLDGDYSDGLTFAATTMVNVERLTLTAGHSYNLTTNDANVAAGHPLAVDGSALGPTDILTFNGSAETDGRFNIAGGAGNDVLTGGARGDTMTGGLGADTLNGGLGHDTFVYGSAAESSSTNFDTVIGFDALRDTVQVQTAVSGIDPSVTSGQLDSGSFDSDMASAMNGTLGANHAILFTPNTGSYGGQTFLIVDQNGVAGYQAGADLVIDLSSAQHLASLSTTDFTT